jgi:hypothetical protein
MTIQRGLLWCGAVGSALFIVIFLINDVRRWYSIAVGIAMPLTFVVAVVATDTLGIWQRLTNVIGWTWLIVLALRAMRVAASSDRVELVA